MRRRAGAAPLAAPFAALAAALWLSPAEARTPVEVALVLAVDASASVSYHEFDLQMRGISAAFRDPVVVAAIEALGGNGVAVSMLQWSGLRDMALAAPWHHIRNAEEESFAAAVDGAGRLPAASGTAIGLAIKVAREVLEQSPFVGARRVIDVSGDGQANLGTVPSQERDIAAAEGITVNGLAILNEEPDLDAYYERNVMGGPASFVIVANTYRDFARAMRIKLLRELGGAVSMR